jgi:ribonuclease VapC
VTIDTSALVAVLLNEGPAGALKKALIGDSIRLISAMTLIEVSCVLGARRGSMALMELNRLLHDLKIEVIPLDQEQVEIAQIAWLRYGRGMHPAALNLGDLAAYALAMARQEPLLFVGEDFQKTDVARVEY